MTGDLHDVLSTAVQVGSVTTSAKTFNSSISTSIEVVMYQFTVSAGQIVDLNINTSLNGPGGLGSFLRLFDSQGTQLDSNNDGNAPGENVIGFDAYLRETFTFGGTYYVGVSNANNTSYDPVTGNGDIASGSNATGNFQLVISALPVDGNDKLSTAGSIGAISTTPTTVNSSLVNDLDVNIYRFTVSAGQVVDFNINTTLNGPDGLGTFLRLFDNQGNELAFNNDANAPGENVIGFDAYLRYTFVNGGTYYIGVSNSNNTLYNPIDDTGDAAGGFYTVGTFQLVVQALPVDTDNTLSTATSLGAATTTANIVDSSIVTDIDVDLYRFTATAGQIVDFNINTPLNGPGGLGSYLRLFNSSGQELAFNNDAAAPGEATVGFDAYLRFTFTTAGAYYIGVSNANNTAYNPITGAGNTAGGFYSIGAYQLIVQALPPDTDNTLVKASALGAVSTTPITVNSTIGADIDIDLYRFTVTAGQVVDFNINTTLNGNGGLDSYLRLFDSQGKELDFNDDAAAPGETQVGFDAYLRHTFATGGTYYIGVSNATNTLYNAVTGAGTTPGGLNYMGAYQLVVQAIQTTPVDTDNTIATATPLGAASTTATSVNASIAFDIDVNMYQFTVTAGQIVGFNINTTQNGPGGLDSYLRLFNASGQELLFNDNAAAPGEFQIGFDAFLHYTFTAAGTYYIGVSNAQNTLYNAVTGAGNTSGGVNTTGAYQLIMLAVQPTMQLTLGSASIPEANGTTTGTVTRSSLDLSQPLLVSLSSSDTQAATVPLSVTIPANQTSASFAIVAVDDHVVNGSKTVTITASASGYSPVSADLTVAEVSGRWHNSAFAEDVNGDGKVNTTDVLLVVNYIFLHGSGPIPATDPVNFLDVTDDDQVNTSDVLQLVNYIHLHGIPKSQAVPFEEGESSGAAAVSTGSAALVDAVHRQNLLSAADATPRTQAISQTSLNVPAVQAIDWFLSDRKLKW